MKTASLVFGIFSFIGMFIAFIPCFGSLNWLNIPFAASGIIISAVALNQSECDDKGSAITGLVLCTLAVIFGFFRLVLGGGII